MTNNFMILNLIILTLLNIVNFVKGTTTEVAIERGAISKKGYVVLSVLSSILYILGIYLTINSNIERPDILAPMIATTMYMSLITTVEDIKVLLTNRWRSRISYITSIICSINYVLKTEVSVPGNRLIWLILFFVIFLLVSILWDIKVFGRSITHQPGDTRMFMTLFPMMIAILQQKFMLGLGVFLIIFIITHIIGMKVKQLKVEDENEKRKVVVPLAPIILIQPYIMFIMIWIS